MRKARHTKYFLQEDLSKHFRWLKAIKQTFSFFPSSTETYRGSFYKNLNDFQRQEFEKFAQDFFETTPHGKHQVICCWQETSLVLIVF